MDQNHTTIQDVARALGGTLTGATETVVTDVTHDSRQAGAGTIFVAIKGSTVDGHRFIDEVTRRGAAGVISESPSPDGFPGSWIVVDDARRSLAKAASFINGDPSHQLDLVGITGTNGKTTTTYLCFALADAAGRRGPQC